MQTYYYDYFQKSVEIRIYNVGRNTVFYISNA